MMISKDNSWYECLGKEFSKPYYVELTKFLEKEYVNHTCFPQKEEIFAAFGWCDYADLKVVIIGQDPYHGMGQANGLCFSVNNNVEHPPSLVNVFKEIVIDLGEEKMKTSGNLQHWAEQGVLLLNATLTVREGVAGSHQNKGWELFTDEVLRIISQEHQDIVFLLWGGFAKKKAKLIDKKKHHVLTSGHPSPLSANRGYWFGNKHFSKTNKILTNLGKKTIDW